MNDIMTINGVSCYEINGTAYLNLENVARGLGFTQEKNGMEYVRWETVDRYLKEIGFPNKLGKDDFIPENIFYRLCMKARNEIAEAFQRTVADEIIPAIRKTGSYSVQAPKVDYMEAAKLIATCKADRLPIVLSLLKQAGLMLPEPQTVTETPTVATKGVPLYAMPNITLDTDIGSLMASKRMSLGELSRRTGISKSALSYYARGIHRTTQERYNLIIDVLTN